MSIKSSAYRRPLLAECEAGWLTLFRGHIATRGFPPPVGLEVWQSTDVTATCGARRTSPTAKEARPTLLGTPVPVADRLLQLRRGPDNPCWGGGPR